MARLELGGVWQAIAVKLLRLSEGESLLIFKGDNSDPNNKCLLTVGRSLHLRSEGWFSVFSLLLRFVLLLEERGIEEGPFFINEVSTLFSDLCFLHLPVLFQ